MSESLPPERRPGADEVEPATGQDARHALTGLLGGQRVRFWIVVLVALLWLLAECTHGNRHARAVEPFELSAGTFSTIEIAPSGATRSIGVYLESEPEEG